MSKVSTREAYGKALEEFGSNEKIVVLDADLSKSTRTELFKNKYPERFFNIGIAEQNLMSIAAGIASCNKIVFASTFAMFAAGRAFEQIRNSICYPKLNVKIGASHSGITVGEDGASHQAIEDMAIMNSIPNMTVISPADSIETYHAVKACINVSGPVYLRFSRLATPTIFDPSTYKFEIGKGNLIRPGNDLTLISIGVMLNETLDAANILAASGINARVINIHTLKPLDNKIIEEAAFQTGAIVTIEEHSIIGGLGSAVASVVCKSYPSHMRMVGVEDKFGKSGSPASLLKMYRLTVGDIVSAALDIIKSKTGIKNS